MMIVGENIEDDAIEDSVDYLEEIQSIDDITEDEEELPSNAESTEPSEIMEDDDLDYPELLCSEFLTTPTDTCS